MLSFQLGGKVLSKIEMLEFSRISVERTSGSAEKCHSDRSEKQKPLADPQRNEGAPNDQF